MCGAVFLTVFVLVLEDFRLCIIKQGYCSGEEPVSTSWGSFIFFIISIYCNVVSSYCCSGLLRVTFVDRPCHFSALNGTP